jgi:hypothetical protein
MPLHMLYRGIWFAKDYITRYLNYVFLANQKGQIVFTDGTREIKFSSTPIAIKRASWTIRELPAVLIGKASGGMKYITFAKDLLKEDNVISDSGEEVEQYTTVGGDFDITIQLAIRATSIEEKDNLVDITGVYLAHPDAKDYFMRHYLVLPDAPTLGAETEIKEPSIDHPIYETTMNLRVMSRWQEWSKENHARLLDIIVDLEAQEPGVAFVGREELID